MKKIFLAGITAVCVLMMGTTALAAETAAPRRSRAHGGCHQQLDALCLRDWARHDCTYVDADGDGICDNCSWHENRHHGLDENGYCLNGACNYENCGYAHGTGYCRGYCNSLTADAGTWNLGETAYQETVPADAGGSAEDTVQENAGVQGTAAAQAAGNGTDAGSGSGSGSNGGYWGSGHHRSGHHGGGHGCH